ncbi:unnamed protein product [Porites lobata]|uniref:DZIP3-like HEPN domain-containing protein n=1 Tax=Porites lobata TaxID=104759 RepID=A0ABN8SJ30_9CNID|nr:unnamed protein product [Porites lobata]
MPSRSEGFGLTGLEDLSAGLPVLVSCNSGFGEALRSVPFGLSVVVNSENPTDWTTAIKKILGKDRKSRLEEVETLRDSYDKKYNWAKQIHDVFHKIISWTHERFNYSRLCRLLISLGSKALREIFDGIIPPQNLQRILKRNPAHSKLQSRRNEGILSSIQWTKLYPATLSSEVSSAGFDIPLLIVLLRTICDLMISAKQDDGERKEISTERESNVGNVNDNEAKLNTLNLFYFFLDLSFPSDILEKIRQVYRIRAQRLLPVPWCEDFSFHLNNIFTRLKIVGKEKTSRSTY